MLGFLLALAAGCTPTFAAPNSAWHLDSLFTLVNERLDPIVSPNGVASHLHDILGGSNFRAAYDYNTYSSSSCSSAGVQSDMSNYWAPKLFWINNATSFTPIPAGHRFYYFLHDASPNSVVNPFPPGLRMLVGNPNSKTANTADFQFACHVNADFSNDAYLDNFNFNAECKGGLRTEVNFPNCWDGKNLYLPNNGHMSTTIGPYCPVSHPVKVPAILLETTYSTSQVAPGKNVAGHLAWANGDTTGYGIHADFVNGWDIEVLHTALNTPACMPNEAVTIGTCPVLAAHMDVAKAQNCKPSTGVMTEPTGGNVDLVPVKTLPGCNPLWGNTPTKPTCSGSTPSPNLSGFTGTDQSLVLSAPAKYSVGFIPTPDPSVNKWTEMTCITSIGNGGTILGSDMISYNDPNLTATSCQNLCAKSGFNWAAVGQRTQWQCQCASSIAQNGAVFPKMCTAKCPGDSTQTCGANGAMTVFYNPKPTITTASLGYYGCLSSNSLQNSATALKAAGSYWTQSNSMTNDLCTSTCKGKNADWAMTYRGVQCFCGNGLAPSDSTIGPDTACNTPCAGNSKEMCGGTYNAAVFSLTGKAVVGRNTTVSTSSTVRSSSTSSVKSTSSVRASSSTIKPTSASSSKSTIKSTSAVTSKSSLKPSSSTVKPTSSSKTSAIASKSSIKPSLSSVKPSSSTVRSTSSSKTSVVTSKTSAKPSTSSVKPSSSTIKPTSSTPRSTIPARSTLPTRQAVASTAKASSTVTVGAALFQQSVPSNGVGSAGEKKACKAKRSRRRSGHGQSLE